MSKQSKLTDIISTLSDDQLDKVLELIKSLTKKPTYSEDNLAILFCPHCGSISIKKNGKGSFEKQRFICKDCNHSFSSSTNVFFSHCRISEDKWHSFIEHEISGISLKEEAYFLNLSIHTCFRMRHKLYKAISEIVNKVKLTGEIQLDAAYRKINLKGTKPQNMPRYSKTRGNGSAYSGISHHKICIVSAIDTEDNMFLKVVGLGSESCEKYRKVKKYMNNIETIISDSKPCIQQFSNEIGAENDKIEVKANKKNYTTKSGKHLGDVNQLDAGITELITRTHGVSTRYFQEYLDFYTYLKKMKYSYKRDEIADNIFSLIKNTKAFTEDEIVLTEMPVSLKEAYYEYRFGIFA